jgi:hypothetical protein
MPTEPGGGFGVMLDVSSRHARHKNWSRNEIAMLGAYAGELFASMG